MGKLIFLRSNILKGNIRTKKSFRLKQINLKMQLTHGSLTIQLKKT